MPDWLPKMLGIDPEEAALQWAAFEEDVKTAFEEEEKERIRQMEEDEFYCELRLEI